MRSSWHASCFENGKNWVKEYPIGWLFLQNLMLIMIIKLLLELLFFTSYSIEDIDIQSSRGAVEGQNDYYFSESSSLNSGSD